MNSRVYIIAYEFYPLNTGGSHRPFRIAKYLSENKYDVEVLTTNYIKSEIDISLLSNLETAKFKITRISDYTKLSNRRSYYFSTVDEVYDNWKNKIWRYIDENITNSNLNYVIVTLPPFSLSKLVIDLKKRYPKINIISDFRDAWSQWNVSPYASYFHYKLTLRKENQVITKSSRVITTSKVIMNDFIEKHSMESKFQLIYNSFDRYINRPDNIVYRPKDLLKIGFVGSFYFNPKSHFQMFEKWYRKKPFQYLQYVPHKENWLYRTPYFLFKVLSQLIKEQPSLKKRIQINLAGNHPIWLNEMINEFGLTSIVRLHGFVPKNKIIYFQNEQDFLLLTSSYRSNKKDYSIPGKTFEYLSIMKPILAIVTESALRDLLAELNCAILLDPKDLFGAKESIKNILENGVELKPNYVNIDKYLSINALKPLLNIIK